MSDDNPRQALTERDAAPPDDDWRPIATIPADIAARLSGRQKLSYEVTGVVLWKPAGWVPVPERGDPASAEGKSDD